MGIKRILLIDELYWMQPHVDLLHEQGDIAVQPVDPRMFRIHTLGGLFARVWDAIIIEPRVLTRGERRLAERKLKSTQRVIVLTTGCGDFELPNALWLDKPIPPSQLLQELRDLMV